MKIPSRSAKLTHGLVCRRCEIEVRSIGVGLEWRMDLLHDERAAECEGAGHEWEQLPTQFVCPECEHPALFQPARAVRVRQWEGKLRARWRCVNEACPVTGFTIEEGGDDGGRMARSEQV